MANSFFNPEVERKLPKGISGFQAGAILSGACFTALGFCWRMGFFEDYELSSLLSAILPLFGWVLFALVLFALGAVLYQTLLEALPQRNGKLIYWLMVIVGIACMICFI